MCHSAESAGYYVTPDMGKLNSTTIAQGRETGCTIEHKIEYVVNDKSMARLLWRSWTECRSLYADINFYDGYADKATWDGNAPQHIVNFHFVQEWVKIKITNDMITMVTIDISLIMCSIKHQFSIYHWSNFLKKRIRNYLHIRLFYWENTKFKSAEVAKSTWHSWPPNRFINL